MDSTVFFSSFEGWKLQFRLGPSLLGRRIRLYVNHPIADEDGNVELFERTQYRQVEWQHDSRNKDDDTAVYADILTIAPGSYHYYMIDHERLVIDIRRFDSSPFFTFVSVLNSCQSARTRSRAVLVIFLSIPFSHTVMMTRCCQLTAFTAKRSSPNVLVLSANGKIDSGLPKSLATISFILLPFRLHSFTLHTMPHVILTLYVGIFCRNWEDPCPVTR